VTEQGLWPENHMTRGRADACSALGALMAEPGEVFGQAGLGVRVTVGVSPRLMVITTSAALDGLELRRLGGDGYAHFGHRFHVRWVHAAAGDGSPERTSTHHRQVEPAQRAEHDHLEHRFQRDWAEDVHIVPRARAYRLPVDARGDLRQHTDISSLLW
jgi:hypothetical protein